jgi:F-type H+-transporting ATPase subunit gamma
MAERLSDVEQRIDSIEQLSSVVTAFRGIAAARRNEAQERLEGIRSYAATVADAIGQALGLMTGEGGAMLVEPEAGAHLVIVLCSEQGFVANFNSRILEEAEGLIGPAGKTDQLLFVVGDRGASIAQERGHAVDWSAPMVAHADEVTSLGNRLADALYDTLENDRVSRASIVHAIPGQGELQVVTKSLIPFDFGRFPSVAHGVEPLITLPLDELAARLAEEYVFAELCEAVLLSYAAENETRMMAMLSARTNVQNRLDELVAKARRMRQEEITAEVIELAAGVEAGGGAGA